MDGIDKFNISEKLTVTDSLSVYSYPLHNRKSHYIYTGAAILQPILSLINPTEVLEAYVL
jgi:hypothetical protein